MSVNAALAGTPQIALGDALGSNVVNVALILGSTLAIAGIRSSRDTIRRDFPVALAVPLVTAVLVPDGVLSRVEGAALFVGFLAWLFTAVVEARRQRRASAAVVRRAAAPPGTADGQRSASGCSSRPAL